MCAPVDSVQVTLWPAVIETLEGMKVSVSAVPAVTWVAPAIDPWVHVTAAGVGEGEGGRGVGEGTGLVAVGVGVCGPVWPGVGAGDGAADGLDVGLGACALAETAGDAVVPALRLTDEPPHATKAIRSAVAPSTNLTVR